MPEYTVVHDGRYTWAQFLDRVQNGKDTMQGETVPSSKDYPSSESWDLNTGYEDALKLAYTGWNAGLAKIEPMTANLLPRIGSHIERVNWKHDVEPAQLDIARYLEDEPECWLTPDVEYIAGQGRLIHIVVNGFLSVAVNADQVVAQGSACCALIQLLELAGHSVKLTWAPASSVSGMKHQTSHNTIAQDVVTVKGFGEPLNMARMAFVLVHPAMQRRLGFRLMERWPA